MTYLNLIKQDLDFLNKYDIDLSEQEFKKIRKVLKPLIEMDKTDLKSLG